MERCNNALNFFFDLLLISYNFHFFKKQIRYSTIKLSLIGVDIMLYILLQYLHWPELNIRKLGCHHRKEQKSSEKHPALHIKILLFQRWLWSFTVHVYFWAILFILKQFYDTDSSVYIYIGSLKWNYQIL